MPKEHEEQRNLFPMPGAKGRLEVPLLEGCDPCRYCVYPTVEGIHLHLEDEDVHICANCMLRAFDRSMSVPKQYNPIAGEGE